MEREKIAQAMPSIRLSFEALKQALHEGGPAAGARFLCGECVTWGDELRAIHAGCDRAGLESRDPLTRFFVTRYRGVEKAPTLTGLGAAELFLLAFGAFTYLDALMDETSIGEHAGTDACGRWQVGRVVAGDYDASVITVEKGPVGWMFDLMPIYRAKAQALDDFIASTYGGDFDAFLWRYVADHDLMFDMERAFRPWSNQGGI